MAKRDREMATNRRAHWQTEIEKAKKRFRTFWSIGDQTVDVYRSQREDGNEILMKDKYNILYSSTETIRPNLYAQRPSVRVKLRNRDLAPQAARDGARLLEGSLSYLIEEEDFDELMENVVEDLLLPGLGQAWVRYEPTFQNVMGPDGKPVLDEAGEPEQELLDEMVKFDYVYWKDFLTGISRGWRTVPWVSRRIWLTKERATARFGADKASKLAYTSKEVDRETDVSSETAEAWEIWDKESGTVYWFAESYSDDLLDVRKDPLKLKNFFPCPRPVRAIYNTRTFVPRAYYTQYKSQAETLNVLTRRIRLLGEALRVVGLYDGQQTKLADLLNPNAGNKMIAVDNWAVFAQAGGIKGNIEWLPLDQVITTLIQLQQAREICKNEIYEITGFSDIVRGQSKASETLGAQNIKANWAGARVKKAQKEVQRFARDLIAIAGEVVAEHCSPETIALFSGIPVPTPDQVQQDPNLQVAMQQFMQATSFIANESRRVASIDIETDSTILADEEADRKDRTEFLAAAGAFLQQAVPAMQTTPELGPLLGAMLMFTIRTFPSSRSIEEEFEKVQNVLANKPPKQEEQDPNGHAAKAGAAKEIAGIKAQSEQARTQSEQATAQAELQAKSTNDAEKLRLEAQAEMNRHTEAMAKLTLEETFKGREFMLREREVAIKEAELGIKQQVADTQEAAAAAAAENAERQQDTSEAMAEHGASMDFAAHEQKYDQMDREDSRAEGLTNDKD